MKPFLCEQDQEDYEQERAIQEWLRQSAPERLDEFEVKHIGRKGNARSTLVWTESQIVELARMGGVISLSSQAKFFKRPNAFEGSIKSAWAKRFGLAGGTIHGLAAFQARQLVRPKCPYIATRYWMQRKKTGEFDRKLYL